MTSCRSIPRNSCKAGCRQVVGRLSAGWGKADMAAETCLLNGAEPELERDWPRFSTWEAANVHFSRLMVGPWTWQSSNTWRRSCWWSYSERENGKSSKIVFEQRSEGWTPTGAEKEENTVDLELDRCPRVGKDRGPGAKPASSRGSFLLS